MICKLPPYCVSRQQMQRIFYWIGTTPQGHVGGILIHRNLATDEDVVRTLVGLDLWHQHLL
jgi:hypothetical protein